LYGSVDPDPYLNVTYPQLCCIGFVTFSCFLLIISFDYVDGLQVMTVIASPGQGPDRSTEVSYTDTKVKITSLSTRVVASICIISAVLVHNAPGYSTAYSRVS